MEITREELNNLIDLRIEERRANRNAFTEILNGFETELEKFNYEEPIKACGRTYSVNNAYKVRSALAALVKAHFKVRNAGDVSSRKRDEVKALVEKIIGIALPEEKEEKNENL